LLSDLIHLAAFTARTGADIFKCCIRIQDHDEVDPMSVEPLNPSLQIIGNRDD
jgi:hypothetical protein